MLITNFFFFFILGYEILYVTQWSRANCEKSTSLRDFIWHCWRIAQKWAQAQPYKATCILFGLSLMSRIAVAHAPSWLIHEQHYSFMHLFIHSADRSCKSTSEKNAETSFPALRVITAHHQLCLYIFHFAKLFLGEIIISCILHF